MVKIPLTAFNKVTTTLTGHNFVEISSYGYFTI